MGHIGKEFGFVLARTLQLAGAFFELYLSFVELGVLEVQCITLVGQGIGALGQLLVGLFQFGLLDFQMGLRFLEHPRLFFEFFVGGFQLFLLHL